jgi:hypothetical protein
MSFLSVFSFNATDASLKMSFKRTHHRISIIFSEIRSSIKKKGAFTYFQFPKRNSCLAHEMSSVAPSLWPFLVCVIPVVPC